MNLIKVNTTNNIEPFGLPKFQDLHFILKSLLMYPELKKMVTSDDVFTFDKEDGNFILLHYNAKYNEERPILAFSENILRNNNAKTLHSYIFEYVKHAWIEKMI